MARESKTNRLTERSAPSREQIERDRAKKRKEKQERLFADLQELTAELLGAIDAPGLIVIDDEAESIGPYFEAYAAARDQLDSLVDDEEIGFDANNDLWRREALTKWDRLRPERRLELLAQSRRILRDVGLAVKLTHLSALQEIFPPGLVRIITPEVWEAEGVGLTAGDAPPIVLFDQRLARFDKTGIELLAAYRDSRPERDPPAGILSNEVNEEGVLTTWDPEDADLVPKSSLMLISKKHLSEGKYEEAVALFRLTANLQHLNAARDSVLAGLAQDVDQAAKDVKALTPRALEDVVYRSSGVEGAWEGETLARVAGLYLVRATRRRELNEDLRDIIRRARTLSRYVTAGDEQAASSQVADELHQIENFASREWLNQLKLPLANGDVFEVTSGCGEEAHTGFFVMVGQPCDLVVRPDGTRDARDARLLPIEPTQSTPSEKLLEQPLPAAPPNPLPAYASVMLKRGFHVSLDLLDLCWINEAGDALIDDVDATGEELMLTEGLTQRRIDLIHAAAEGLDHLRKVRQGVSQKASRYSGGLFAQGEIGLDYDPDRPRRWSFPVTRVARLSEHHAEALLVRYAAAQARAAFEHDLTAFTRASGG